MWDLTGVSWSWCWVLSTTGHSRHATRHLLAPPLSPAPHTRARSVRLARPTRSYAINQSIYNCFKYGQNRRHSRTSTSPLQTRPGRRLWCGEVLKGMLFYLGETQVIYTPAPATISIILECFASPKKYEVIMCAELSRKIGKGSQARTESTDYIIIIFNIFNKLLYKQIFAGNCLQISLWNFKRFHFIKEWFKLHFKSQPHAL